ncbi:antibiotic biosynthesis monooxygenase [Roseomonas hellenica]|uniref:Antibiotic biosynthesis monooxygenase n=2 Tax=Plastoroseomonas hellenica TaxID=2687306 RepID=A0ABS5EWL0_9PROT|nr:antibiotic biosynthesis monooxygenase [Plastoroseomonas hellenica]
MPSVALLVELKAKLGKEEEVAAFLERAGAVAAAEVGTLTWFAVRFDRTTFAIFDTFSDKGARHAHLGGQIAEALIASAADLLATPPEIRAADVLAAKLPG